MSTEEQAQLQYWAVSFIMTLADGTKTRQRTVATTDGDYTPHDDQTVRAIIETRFGPTDACTSSGPYASYVEALKARV
jgi:hypothetical protein